MRISQTGGLIAAGSRQVALPMLQVGSIPIIERVVITFQQAGIFPIVIVTGADEEDVKYRMAGYGVIFLHSEQPDGTELFSSVKQGLRYLQGKCGRVVFTPVNVPMFTPSTLTRLLAEEGDVVTPSCQGRSGHPAVIAESVIPEVLAYDGGGGLRGALRALEGRRRWLSVEDEGVLVSIHDPQQMQERLAAHNDELLHPMLHMRLERESAFFDGRLKLLLFLIDDTRNVRRACDAMAISYGKAWNLINRLERELGYQVVERRQGGHRGGNTELTEQGAQFLRMYQSFEEKVFQFAQREFQTMFFCTKDPP